MLVGHDTISSDSNIAMKALRKRMLQSRRGVGDASSDAVYNIDSSLPSTSYYPDLTTSSVSNYPSSTNSQPSAWTSIANLFSSIAPAASKAFASTQTQCSIGTSMVGNQCLPNSMINYGIATNPTPGSTLASSLNMSSLSSMLPWLIGGAVLLMMMNKH